LPKEIFDKLRIEPGAFFLVEERGGKIVYTPAAVVARTIAEATATPREARALDRVIAADKRGETIPYEQYRAARAARVGGRGRQARSKATR
jgi:hypothetical protein